MILEYWPQLVTVVALIASYVRLEMLAKQNAKRLTDLEERLNASTTSEWISFKAVTEVKLEEHRREIHKLFDLNEK